MASAPTRKREQREKKLSVKEEIGGESTAKSVLKIKPPPPPPQQKKKTL